MSDQLKKQEITTGGDENLIKDLSSQIYNLLSNYEIIPEDDFIFEHSNDIFKRICRKAKDSIANATEQVDKEKLCYMAAVYVLKSGLYYVLEKAYKNGFDFEDL